MEAEATWVGGGENAAQLRGVFSPLHKGPARPPICVVSQPAQALTPEGHPSVAPHNCPALAGAGALLCWGSHNSSAHPTLQLSQASDLGLPGPLRSLLTSLGLTIFCSSASQSVLTSPRGCPPGAPPPPGGPPTHLGPLEPPTCSLHPGCRSSDLPPAGQLGPGSGTGSTR